MKGSGQTPPRGGTIFLNKPTPAATMNRSLRTARNAPSINATARGSDPPRNERCIQSKFKVANSAATHPPQSRCTNAMLSKHEKNDTRRRLVRSEEHTSELQSLAYLVCRLLLEKKTIHAHEH